MSRPSSFVSEKYANDALIIVIMSIEKAPTLQRLNGKFYDVLKCHFLNYCVKDKKVRL